MLIYLVFLIWGVARSQVYGVIFQPPNEFSNVSEAENVWTSCWRPENNMDDLPQLGVSLAACAKQQMYQNLVAYVDQQCVDVGDGVTLISNGDSGLTARDLFPLGEEPSTYRHLADAYSSFLSRRGIQWNLGHFYPGLTMRIGPTINGDGVLEFVMDRRLDYADRAKLGPGQQMIRRTILPHLLGFRMNLATMLPLMFGILIYVAKNAFIFSKITLVISTLLALKSLFVMQHYRPPQYGHPGDFLDSPVGSHDPVNFIGGPKFRPPSLLHPENLVLQMFSAAAPPFRGVNDKAPEEEARGERGQRNFSWQ